MARKALRHALATAVLAAGLAAPVWSQSVTLTPAELRAEAMRASQTGEYQAALGMAEALLARDPQDFTALIIASRVNRDLGNAGAALAHALAASELAKTDAERFSASLLVAQALATAGRRTEAQLWLRWAANQAPNDQARAVALRDFRYVRSRNPVKLDFGFDVAPSNNINNGSSSGVATIFGDVYNLTPDAQALSGVRIAASADLTWRFPATERRRAQATLSFYHRTHVLSDDAKLQSPATRADEFDYTGVTANYREVLNFGPGKGLWGWDIAAGRVWYGKDPLSDFVDFGVDRTIAWGEVGNVTIAGALGHQRYIEGSGVTATTVELTAALDRRLASGGRLSFQLGIEDSISDEPNIDFTAYRLDAAWRLGQPVLGAAVTLSAGLELKEFPFSLYTPLTGRREDVTRQLSAEFLFPNAQRWGFAPTVSANYNLRGSNADRYDTETFSVELGIRSVF